MTQSKKVFRGNKTHFFSKGSFLLFLFLSSCAPKAPPRIALPESESRKILQDADSYLRSLQIVRSAQGYARVRLKVKGGSRSFDEAVVIRLPASFRFETLDDLGNTRFLIVSEGATLSWRDYEKKETASKELSEEELKRFLPMASSITETLGLFVGRLPVRNLKEAQVFREEGASSHFRIVFDGGEMIWDPTSRSIVFLALRGEDGKFLFQYEGRDFSEHGTRSTKETSVRLPSRIHLKDLKTKNEIDLNYRDLQVDLLSTGLDPLLFMITPSGNDSKGLDDR